MATTGRPIVCSTSCTAEQLSLSALLSVECYYDPDRRRTRRSDDVDRLADRGTGRDYVVDDQDSASQG